MAKKIRQKSGWEVNGDDVLARFTDIFFEMSRTSKKVVPFSRLGQFEREFVYVPLNADHRTSQVKGHAFHPNPNGIKLKCNVLFIANENLINDRNLLDHFGKLNDKLPALNH